MADVHPIDSKQILRYNPQIDGLRFCAVLFIVSYHWLTSVSSIQQSYFFGGMVNFFFVLSSYLITRILFSAREKSRIANIPSLKVIVVFLIRRTIRIFPAYYFFLLMVLLMPVIGNQIKDSAGMYFAYLSNYAIFYSHSWPHVSSHLWTLAVEEQFYLIWPIVIIFVPRRHLLKTFLFIIIGSVILKAVYYYPAEVVPQDILTQFCVDAFAVGGILAYKYTAPEKERRLITKYFNIVFYAGIPLCIIIILTKSYYFSFVINRLLFAVFSMKAIEGAVIGYKSYFGRFLERKWVLYLGRISYGIYLYHLLIPVVFWKIYDIAYYHADIRFPSFFTIHKNGILTFQSILSSEAVCYVIYALLTVGVASFSWYFIEKPINKFKPVIDFNIRKAALNRFRKIATGL
ncbi:MAG: acyltransferase [Ferruginibacter sp.]